VTVQFLVEEHNPAAVDEAMRGVSLHPRYTMHVRVAGVVHRFIKDRFALTVGPYHFLPLPYMEIGDIATSSGDAAANVDVVLDAAHLVEPTSDQTLEAYENVVDMNLRNAAMQIGLVMLDPQTMQPVGLAAEFVGLISGVPFRAGVGNKGPQLIAECLSFVSVARRLTARVYSNEDQQELHPLDGGFVQLADTYSRNGSYIWNGKDAGSGGSTSGGGGGGGGGRTDFGNLNLF